MRDFLKKHSHRLTAGWFWSAVLLILPACGFTSGALGPGLNLDKGTSPHDAALFCDIEKVLGRHCATARDMAMGIRLSEAAVALAEGRQSDVGLDDSPEALGRCGGQPEAVLFEGPFPQGLPVCLNCDTITANFAGDNDAACRVACHDLFGPVNAEGNRIPENPPDPLVVAFCADHARASTNFGATSTIAMPASAPTGCFATGFTNACAGGIVSMGFADPRKFSEAVVWQHLTAGVAAGGAEGNDLERTAATSNAHDQGAVSTQWFGRGDGWVEFSVKRGSSQFVGFAEVSIPCIVPCADPDADIPKPVALLVRYDGRLFVYEGGALKVGPGPEGSFGESAEGQRLRVRLRDNGNGTATVRYTMVNGFCSPGTTCMESGLDPSSSSTITYPVRVDTSLFHQGATITDARLVRIK